MKYSYSIKAHHIYHQWNFDVDNGMKCPLYPSGSLGDALASNPTRLPHLYVSLKWPNLYQRVCDPSHLPYTRIHVTISDIL